MVKASTQTTCQHLSQLEYRSLWNSHIRVSTEYTSVWRHMGETCESAHTHTKPRAPALPLHHNYIYYSIYGHCSTHTGWSETSLPAPRFIETDADVLSWMGHDCGLRGLTSINTPVERSEISVQISSQTLMYDSVVKPCNYFLRVPVYLFSANCGTRYDENVS